MSFVPNLALSSRVNMLNLINHDNNRAYTFQKVSLAAPIPIAGNPSYNTRIRLNAIPGSGYINYHDYNYNRLDIGTFLAPMAILPSELTGTTIYGLLDQINTILGLSLAQYEVVDGPVNLSTDSSIDIVVTSLSEMWIPGTVLSIALGAAPALPNGTFIDMGGGFLFGLDNNTLLSLG